MKMRWLLAMLMPVLGGCAQDDTADLKQFMQDAGKDSPAQLEPMPTMKPAESFAYLPTDLSDPFKPRNMRPSRGGGNQPDFDRPKEPLELFPLDSLRMVGTLMRGKQMYALVRTPENTLYRVKKGDHIGQNFGVIISISEAAIDIRETVQDSAGDWTEGTVSMPVSE